MALGGGNFVTQNKVLPGSYINFVSLGNSASVFGERGVCAAPLNIDWGEGEDVIEVTGEDFEKSSLKIFGYEYNDEKMKPYRDMYKNAKSCYFYRVSGGTRATAEYGTARCSGERGNSIFYTIAKNVDDPQLTEVCTYIRNVSEDTDENKSYDMTESISSDIVNVGGKASVQAGSGSKEEGDSYTVIDEIRAGQDLNTDGTPKSRALCFQNITAGNIKVKVSFYINQSNEYDAESVSGSRVFINNRVISPDVNENTAVFTITKDMFGENADEDIYFYGTVKVKITAINIVREGSISDVLADKQIVQNNLNKLTDNDFIVWKKESKELTETAGTFLTGGSDSAPTGQSYQDFLNKIEGYDFNVLICDSNDSGIKSLFANFTERLRDDMGIKFQSVMYNYKGNYEGIINVSTKARGEDENALVWWIGGASAACEVNKSCTNMLYEGEYEPVCNDTQNELASAVNNGEFKIHKVGNDYRVLMDINSLTEFTESKGEIFKENQTIRVCDQIAEDIAAIFNTKYLGKVQNDSAGRTAFWADIVKHHNKLNDLRAIEDFTGEDVKVSQGESKNSVVVSESITVVNAMTKLYMTVVVE